jgi:hypothetical protein
MYISSYCRYDWHHVPVAVPAPSVEPAIIEWPGKSWLQACIHVYVMGFTMGNITGGLAPPPP